MIVEKAMWRVFFIGAVMAASAAVTAQAAPERDPGMSCRAAGPAAWWGRFSGGKETYGGFDQDIILRHTEERCFRTQAGCQRWLYLLKSEYGYAPAWNECRKGYQPGAPVKPWYAPGQ